MSADAAESACTEAQRAEWTQMHDRMRELTDDAEQAERMASLYLGDHLAAGAMTPGPYGVPTPEAIDSYRRACQFAQEANQARQEWNALHQQAEAHPYTADVRARLEQRQHAG